MSSRGAYLRRAQQWYALDWVAAALLEVGAMAMKHVLHPVYRVFYLDDPRLQFPYADPETVTGLQLFLYILVVPLAVITAWAVITRPGFGKAYIVFLGLFVTLSAGSFMSGMIKNSVGRPRPDLLARCIPAPNTPRTTLVTVDVCTQTDDKMLSLGWRSFPSGHSTGAFGELGFLSFFLCSQLHVFHPRSANLFTTVLALSPFAGAILIAASRLQDYRHDYADVLAGSLLGLGIAYATWRRYFPALSARDCHEPYAVSQSLRAGGVEADAEVPGPLYTLIAPRAVESPALRHVRNNSDIEMGPINAA